MIANQKKKKKLKVFQVERKSKTVTICRWYDLGIKNVLKETARSLSNNLSINCYKLQSYCKNQLHFYTLAMNSLKIYEAIWLTIVSKRSQILKIKFNKWSRKHTPKNTKYCWKKLNKTKPMESYSMLIDLKFWCWSTYSTQFILKPQVHFGGH